MKPDGTPADRNWSETVRTTRAEGSGMLESDLDYLRRRAAEEERRSEEAMDERTAAIHRRMATLYADRVSALTDNPDFDPIMHLRPKGQSPTRSR